MSTKVNGMYTGVGEGLDRAGYTEEDRVLESISVGYMTT